jgi:Transcriptional regulatory protein, C terminal/FHA domain
MEFRSPPVERGRQAEIVLSSPDGTMLQSIPLTGERLTAGRLPEANDIALQPDPELLVTRVAQCTFEREGGHWFVVDGGSVNGTFLRRGGTVRRVAERTKLHSGDVVCVLGSVSDNGARSFFELAFHKAGDSQATRAALVDAGAPQTLGSECLRYDPSEARLFLVRPGERHEVRIRAQGHRLVRYMAERNAAERGPVLCTHEELMHAVWADEPMHTRMELAKLVWELRKKLEPFGAQQLIESERRLGYRMRTCESP